METGKRSFWGLDILLFLVLTLAAIPIALPFTRGDLWTDEADYALAGTRGFEANRWDKLDPTGDPEGLHKLRHYHAPLTAEVLGGTASWSTHDRSLRLPFLVAGGLSVGMVYLCGLALFGERREVSVGCALLVMVSPPHLRMSSHALPWAFLTLELLLLLWAALQFVRSRRALWLAGTGVALGLLFVTTEMFFVALAAAGVALLPALVQEGREKEKRRELAAGCCLAFTLFVGVGLIFWPAGLAGNAIQMLGHYVEMRHETFPAIVNGRLYLFAPKWAYLYWYRFDYFPYFCCYALGLVALPVLLNRRLAPPGTFVLLVFAGILLMAAHTAHIIGPEYLAHCLPFLTLLGGLFYAAVSRKSRPLGFTVLLLTGAGVSLWTPPHTLAGMDSRAQTPRWPQAVRYLAANWRQGNRLLVGPQPPAVARWYLVYDGHVVPYESQIVPLPGRTFREGYETDIRVGNYRYLALTSTFLDFPEVDAQTTLFLPKSPLVWRSPEDGPYPSRFRLYELAPSIR